MQQYFVQGTIEINDHIEFNSDQSHHIKDVLRMREGTLVRVVNDQQSAAFAKIQYQNKQVIGIVDSFDPNNSELKCQIKLCVGLIKKEKWDYLLQKCTELGVSYIVPFESSRTVVKSKDEKIAKKMERWNKIVQEAAEQSKRNYIPKIMEPISFKDIKKMKSDVNCVAYEDINYTGQKLNNLIKKNMSSITVVIGPEGGFDTTEVDYLCENGFQCVSLGKRILRAETAATYVVSVIDALCE